MPDALNSLQKLSSGDVVRAYIEERKRACLQQFVEAQTSEALFHLQGRFHEIMELEDSLETPQAEDTGHQPGDTDSADLTA